MQEGEHLIQDEDVRSVREAAAVVVGYTLGAVSEREEEEDGVLQLYRLFGS